MCWPISTSGTKSWVNGTITDAVPSAGAISTISPRAKIVNRQPRLPRCWPVSIDHLQANQVHQVELAALYLWKQVTIDEQRRATHSLGIGARGRRPRNCATNVSPFNGRARETRYSCVPCSSWNISYELTASTSPPNPLHNHVAANAVCSGHNSHQNVLPGFLHWLLGLGGLFFCCSRLRLGAGFFSRRSFFGRGSFFRGCWLFGPALRQLPFSASSAAFRRSCALAFGMLFLRAIALCRHRE